MAAPLTRAALLAALLMAGARGQAQQLAAPQAIERAPAAPLAAPDAAETPMLAAPSMAGSLQAWYAAARRPPLVLYFDRKLEQLPPGWRGSSRLLIEDKSVAGGKEENRKITVGVQRNTEVATQQKTQFAALFEQALQAELKRQKFAVLDGSVLQRRQAAGQPGEGVDTEYASLRKSARFVFEVELLVLNGEVELVGVLKDIHNGALTATVRHRVEGGLASPAELDRASRALVQRLLRHPMA